MPASARPRRGGGGGLEAWPGYVDALSTLLMVVMFVLLVFVLAQAFQTVVLGQRNAELQTANQTLLRERERGAALAGSVVRLNRDVQVGEAARAALLRQLRDLNTQTANTMAERDNLAALLKQVEIASAAAQAMNRELTGRLEAQTKRTDAAEQVNARLRLEAEAAAARLQSMRQQIESLDRTVVQDRATIDAKVSELARLAEQTAALTALRDDLTKQVSGAAAAAASAAERRQAIESMFADEKKLGETARARIALLAQQNDQLRAELAASERLRAEEQERASSLTSELNLALAAQVEELRKYRSEFFGRLRAVLAGRPGITIAGDRFVFQSEVLFAGGSAELTPAGVTGMADFASAFRDISARFPADLTWVLRIDGHTDIVPVHTWRFASNWELSSARAITVVKFLIARGVPAPHLAATGFAENQPIDPGDSPEAYAKNRRIEIRLTDR